MGKLPPSPTGQQGCGGPDAGVRHRGRNRGERAGLKQSLNLSFRRPALSVNGRERADQKRDHDIEDAAETQHGIIPQAFRKRSPFPETFPQGSQGTLNTTGDKSSPPPNQ